jgi:hypothetical protein
MPPCTAPACFVKVESTPAWFPAPVGTYIHAAGPSHGRPAEFYTFNTGYVVAMGFPAYFDGLLAQGELTFCPGGGHPGQFPGCDNYEGGILCRSYPYEPGCIVGVVTFAAVQPPTPSTSSVPGPLPLLGAAAAFGFSRKLRKRIKVTRTTAPTRPAG